MRNFYVLKLDSGYLKQHKNKVTTNFTKLKKNSNVIGLGDSQMLRLIRKLTNHNVDMSHIERLYYEMKLLKKQKSSKENSKRIFEIQKEIDDILFIPEYVTVEMRSEKQYRKLFDEGFTLNIGGKNRKYKRLACSASQARCSIVTFCDEEILDTLKLICNNGRNVNKELSPAKYNAYFGLYLSQTQVVRNPRFCVVRDYENKKKVTVNYVTETPQGQDDEVEVREIDMPFNRTDGMGLITPDFARLWADDLGLDYVPAQFCIRQSWIKGMLCVFDIIDFCEKKNGGKYTITDIYGNEVDLRNIDIILSESQFKLWDSYPNQKYYEECCEMNGLNWGVSIYTPKQDKDILNLNYQFLQTLDLDDDDIEYVCRPFEDWITSISGNDINSVLLFLLGSKHTEKTIQNYMRSSDNYWVKCLVANPQLIHDKFIKQKIYNLIKTKISEGCLGRLIADGNFQVIVSDPYAMMEHVCGLEVKGILKDKEFYSNYWNNKGVKVVDGMRSPLTFINEHVKMDLVKTEETEYWYKYMYTGVVLNYYGSEVLNFGGSDFDIICPLIQ